jgi:hypothetical protein
MSAKGQKQTSDIDVRFTPKSGHSITHPSCPLCAISGLLQRSKHHISELPDNGFHRAPAK